MLKNTLEPLKSEPWGGYFEEKQYLRLIGDIIQEGTLEEGILTLKVDLQPND